MAWHWGYCPICKRMRLIGYVSCLKLEICIDCFWGWSNGEIEIKQSWELWKN